MNKLMLMVFLMCYNLFGCIAQMNIDPDLQSLHYEKQLAKAQNFALNAIDTNELKFALWMNENFEREDLNNISEIFSVPSLEIQDNCFVALDCDYSHRNFLYCITFFEPDYKEYFIRLNGDKWIHFIYDSKDILKSTCSSEYYMYADICRITDLVKFRSNGLVKIARNLCILDTGEIYTFLKGKPILFREYYTNWIGHNPHYLDGCVLPDKLREE